MRKPHRIFALLLLGLLPAAAEEPRKLEGDPAFRDLSNTEWRPAAPAKGTLHLLVFTTIDCPIANAYQPTLRRLAEAYRDRGVHLIQVHVDPTVDARAAIAHSREFGITTPVVRDTDHRLVRWAGATITPEAFLVGAKGEVLYHGRIDDWYTRLGQRRQAPRTHDLRNALEAVLAGKVPAIRETQAVGCYIADLAPVPSAPKIP